MRPIKKKNRTAKEIERSIKHLILDMAQYDCIKADGSLDDHFILSYLLRNSDHAVKEYNRILLAYEKVKKNETFIKVMQSRKVDSQTLKRIVLFYESIVRPIKVKDDLMGGGVYIGEILKLPSLESGREYDEGEEWKTLLHKEKQYKVGDKVFYNMKSNIILDYELLHLVGMFIGKLLE